MTDIVGVAGAGSIGCYVGGCLAAAGRPVRLLARPRLVAAIAQHGLSVSAGDGATVRAPADMIRASDDPAILRDATIILVTVKSADTAAMANTIADHARSDAIIVSLQNGIENVGVLRAQLPHHTVLAGMVPFNVIGLDDARFHRATTGDILVEANAAKTGDALSTSELAVRSVDDITGVQWGKLLINLNNALNALSGLPLRDQLSQRPWRLLFAAQMSEGLAAMKAAGITPLGTTGTPPWLVPHILRLPDPLFRMIAARMVRIDANARSSMWDDLQQRRRTEIDFLQGAIVTLARRHGVHAPLCERIVSRVKAAEAAGHGSPGLKAEDVFVIPERK